MLSKFSKIGLLLLLPFIFEITSCCDRDCLPTTFIQYTNCTIEAENLDNSGPSAVVSTSSTINRNAYGIRLSVIREVNYCEANSHFSFIPSAIASSGCYCDPPYFYNSIEAINTVTVITLNDFNQNNVALADITNKFKVFNNDEFIDINDYGFPTDTHSQTRDNGILNFELDMLLFETDIFNVNQQFQVNVKLSDGRILSANTNLVLLD